MNKRQQKKGVVVRSKNEKTIVVEVERIWQHPIYGKRLTRSKEYFVHAEKPAEIGQKVLIEECRPISKKKRWRLVEFLDKEGN
jgi:small subunit ribosomal protein S17